jgi:fermentation-respiration switch protein FrsA (DUF1100 family)
MLMKRFVVACATLILVGVVCAISAGWLLAHPIQTRIGSPPTDLNAQAVSFASDSGATVHGWWSPVRNDHDAVLLLPGIRANRLSMVDPTARVAIIGSSLGGVAALLATPPLKVDALILEEVYPTIETATRNRMENYLGGIGRVLTPALLNQLRWQLGVSASQLRPVDHIGDVQCPVFIISGEKDRNTRPADTRMLFEHAGSPKQLWFVPNAGHVDLYRATAVDYESRVLAFLKRM